MLLNLGSICILGSLAVLKGGFYQYFVKDLLFGEDKPRRVFALGYYGSILLSIYASMILKSYILTLITMALEMVLLLYFICSGFPGGSTGVTYLLGFVKSLCLRCLRIK